MPLICPYCRTDLAPEQEGSITCEECGTPHHVECYEENGGCTLFGCKLAPPDDPKLQVSTGDISQFPTFGVPTFQSSATGFGDVAAPAALAMSAAPNLPPPPPPPSSELRFGSVSSPPPTSTLLNPPAQQPKARIKFILLGIFLGCFGVHNFYAGYTKRGVWQLCITVLTFFYASFAIWIWAIVEICTVEHDNNNISFV